MEIDVHVLEYNGHQWFVQDTKRQFDLPNTGRFSVYRFPKSPEIPDITAIFKMDGPLNRDGYLNSDLNIACGAGVACAIGIPKNAEFDSLEIAKAIAEADAKRFLGLE